MATRLKQRQRQQQPVSRDHERVGAHRAHLVEFRGAFQAARLKDPNAVFHGEAFDRARYRAQPPASGSVGLRQNQDDLVANGHEARQCSLSELGRAGED